MNVMINQVSRMPIRTTRLVNRTILILSVAVAVFLFTSHGRMPGAHAADMMHPKYTMGSGKVISVYEAQEGTAVYRAYVVLWKEHRVVVNDVLAKTKYKEGDLIDFMALTLPNPIIDTKPDILSFQTVPARGR